MQVNRRCEPLYPSTCPHTSSTWVWGCDCPPHSLVPTGVEGFTSQEDQEMLSRIEKQLKRRFAIGSQVSEHSIVQDFTKQVGLSPQ